MAIYPAPLFCRRRHQPRRPPLAKIRPGRPAPAMGPGTALGLMSAVRENEDLGDPALPSKLVGETCNMAVNPQN